MEPTVILNQYIKVLVVTQRAKQLEKGARPRVQVANNKRTVIALREVEEGLISFDFPSNVTEVLTPR